MTALESRRPLLSVLQDRPSDAALMLDQLRGIEAWTRAHPVAVDDLQPGISREQRLDLARRRDVVARQREALLTWTARQLRDSGEPLHSLAPVRVVLAHRNAWFRSKVVAGLQDSGISVVAEPENGADAVGIVVAEQPDVLLLEDKLPMVSGLELCREVPRWAPRTVLAVQVAEEWQVGPFLEAGAATVFTRRTPPADVAAELAVAVRP